MAELSGIGVFWAFVSILSAIISSVGFFMPYWITGKMSLNDWQNHDRGVPVYFGVFRRCNYPALVEDGKLAMIHECGRYTSFGDIPSFSWQIATLTLGVGCCLCFLVALTAVFGVWVKGVVIATVARTSAVIQMCSGRVLKLAKTIL